MPPVILGTYVWVLCYTPYVRLMCVHLAISRGYECAIRVFNTFGVGVE